MKNIRIEAYDWEEVLNEIPFGMENLVNIEVYSYGYIHDTGVEVTIRKACDGHPANIAEAHREFESKVALAFERWEFCNNFGYH